MSKTIVKPSQTIGTDSTKKLEKYFFCCFSENITKQTTNILTINSEKKWHYFRSEGEKKN